MTPPHSPNPQRRLSPRGAVLLLQLLLLGAVVGMACWPLNALDHLQDQLLKGLPGWTGQTWSRSAVLLAASPVAVMPLLLWLQAGPLRAAAGSGVSQTLESLDKPPLAPALLSSRTTLARLLNWAIATLALLPLGREGPLVQLGSAVALGLRRRCPRLLASLSHTNLVAIGAGAGLAGGFNSPLMGAVFVMEELLGRYQPSMLWPAALACAAAALVGQIGGMPLYDLGLVTTLEPEWQQLAWGLLIGIGAGSLGGVMAKLLLLASTSLKHRLRQAPGQWGLALGGTLALLAFLSQGWSGGDGEALLAQLLQGKGPLPIKEEGGSGWLSGITWLGVLASRLLGPVIALGAGIPGGLIDPAFGLGGVFGAGLLQLSGGNPELGLALGMAGGLAGATQLPLMTVLFSLRMAGDLQWLLGLLVSSMVGAYAGRRIQPQAIYHALWELQQAELNRAQSAPRR
jgi:H+/Cl- antiporter ClcA